MTPAGNPAMPAWGYKAAAPEFRPESCSPVSLSVVVYSSRAVAPLSPHELQRLTVGSQQRNSRDGITGLMLYDEGRFYQWLEGPPDKLDRLFRAIRSDPRHTDIEVLGSFPARARRFGGWTMELVTSGKAAFSWRREAVQPVPAVLRRLRAEPRAAPVLLLQLVAAIGADEAETPSDAIAHLPLPQKTATVLRNVFLSRVIPQLSLADGARGLPDRRLPAHPRAAELAELLTAADPTAAHDLIEALRQDGTGIGPFCATLLEPAARSLGDLWQEDFCTEFDVTLALCRLQTAVRLLAAGTAQRPPSRLKLPAVLVVPEPGELHRLGAGLDSTVLRGAGWSPQCEFPTDDKALQDILAGTWFDVLDLSLSAAFRREQELPRLTRTIALARQVSRNPALVVMVGGRVFVETRDAVVTVGADRANRTALNVNRTILRTLAATRLGNLAPIPTAS